MLLKLRNNAWINNDTAFAGSIIEVQDSKLAQGFIDRGTAEATTEQTSGQPDGFPVNEQVPVEPQASVVSVENNPPVEPQQTNDGFSLV